MTGLLALREKLKEIYGKYDIYITPLIKFVFALLALIMINSELGYMDKLSNPLIVIVLCLICTLLPNCITVLVMMAVILGHLYALSIETCIVALCLFVLMYLFYFRFTSSSSMWVIITPLFFLLKLPYVIPVIAGLAGGALTALPVSFGVLVYQVMKFGADYSAAITADVESSDVMQKFSLVLDGVLSDSFMLVVLSFIITIVLVAVIKKLPIDYAWIYAIIAGTLTNFIILLVGNIMFSAGLSIVEIILNSLIAMAAGYVLDILLFSADYSRTERVQYEDDDYHYYVKAVPKCSVPVAEVKVKKINTQKVRRTTHEDEIDIDFDIDE
jgi:hypothetical protein